MRDPEEPLPQDIRAAGQALRSGRLTCVALAQACLGRIAALEPRLNAFISVLHDGAVAAATQLDADLSAGRDRGPLHGIPIVAKDIFDSAGTPTTVGSRACGGRAPASDALALRRLQEAGAVLLGKTNMNELAAGVTGANEAFGDTRNPWDPARWPGGSSSGSAAAVSAGLCLGAAGTDTGGSIRIPAAWCGVPGMRPTQGRVSLEGVHPRAPSLDTAGPIAATVADMALLLGTMAGVGAGSEPVAGGSRAQAVASGPARPLTGLRLGVIRGYTYAEIDTSVARAVGEAVDTLARLGAELVEVEVPELGDEGHYVEAFNTILLHEFAQVVASMTRSRSGLEHSFGAIVRANLEAAAGLSRHDCAAAGHAREALTRAIRGALAGVDALFTPAQPMVAPPRDAPPAEIDRSRRFMVPFSLAGVPAAVVPCGFADGLPVGLQIVAGHGRDAMAVRIAAAFEAATEHHARRPPLAATPA